MLDLKKDLPLKESLKERKAVLYAQMRDILNEVEMLDEENMKTDRLWKKSEVAEFFRCDEKHIPTGLKGIRAGKQMLYSEADIYKFIESKKRK